LIVMILVTLTALINGIIAGGASNAWAVLDIVGLATSVGRRIFGEGSDSDTGTEALSTPVVIFAALAWSALAAAFCRFRYQRIEVRQ
jgi:hypothetical protein